MSSSAPKPNSISILVHPNDLKGSANNGLRKGNRFSRRTCFRRWRRVSVEAAPAMVRDRVFYAPDESHKPESTSRTATQYIRITPDVDNLVKKGDEFEISFVGMNISPQDLFACNKNELVLYSLTSGSDSAKCEWAQKISSANSLKVNMQNGFVVSDQVAPDQSQPKIRRVASIDSRLNPALSTYQKDVPFIHYDTEGDGRTTGTKPNTFVPIPASKAVYKQFRRSCRRREIDDDDISVRFEVLDIDKVSDEQIEAVFGITQLGDFVEKGAVALPYAELVARAFQAVAAIGKRGLRKYSAPDHVLPVDMKFRLANSHMPAGDDSKSKGTNVTEHTSRANYLRYGYYFFLEKNVDAKLYVQTRSSAQNVPLLLRRTDFDAKCAQRNELEWFPMTNVSYVVMKVSPACTSGLEEQKMALCKAHKQRLDAILQVGNILEMLEKNKKRREPSSLRTVLPARR
ncbi:hypothetical protein BWQ96_08358 [Gracilariopsis chorda]|uniref:Uncharacterized protein n=1 Tax=Gracilariopsis chorda TaxID=448386 RepID=A0A2V3III8_9FLOR|nr:hypothetical protein BWQ96_08358 [Gracilariopsis chorda]|eukprot:PXF41906.1 hypothetical protein BWQ96_08358 [Gracilariopsis chorda]